MHKILQIVKGIPKAVGDSESAELGVQVLDLVSDHGLMLDPAGGWLPKIAGSDGVWAENPLAVGRELIGGEDGNVVETMKLAIHGDRIYTHLTILNLMIQAARQFWTTEFQTEPVYLKWEALGSAGPQYALIYNLSVDFAAPSATDQVGPADVTLTVEREPYWRALPPGQNPKVYTFERAGTKYSLSDLSLWTGSDHFKTATVQNRHEWATGSDMNTPASQNYLDIAATAIPGDAPALVCLQTDMDFDNDPAASSAQTLRIARYTRPLTLTRRSNPGSLGSSSARNAFNILNACDANIIGAAGATNDATYGVKVSSAATQQIVTLTTWSTSYAVQLAWRPTEQFDFSRFAGRWAMFCRCQQNGGAAGDISVKGAIADDVTLTYVLAETPSASPVVDEYTTLYLGALDIPPHQKAGISIAEGGGLGLYLQAYGVLQLQAKRASGAATLSVVDVLLMPIDEPSLELENGLNFFLLSNPTGGNFVIYDNTGYLAHGGVDDSSLVLQKVTSGTTYGELQIPNEVRGQSLVLQPGVDNRLYFYSERYYGLAGTDDKAYVADLNVRINIVPRWRGPRDA